MPDPPRIQERTERTISLEVGTGHAIDLVEEGADVYLRRVELHRDGTIASVSRIRFSPPELNTALKALGRDA